jgi:hypothetical protein
VTYASHGMARSDDLSGRLEVWPIAARLFAQHPIRGIGLGAFIASNPRGIATHNLFLGLAAELGLVGLFLYVAAVWSALAKPLRSGIGHWAFWAALALASVWLAIALSGAWDASIVAWFGFAWLSVTPGASPVRPRAAAAARWRRRGRRWSLRAAAPAAASVAGGCRAVRTTSGRRRGAPPEIETRAGSIPASSADYRIPADG